MNIRPAIASDKTAIIQLLKQSLGESLIPKSTELWNWKHEQNPFGQSYVLLAEEADEIIGVRAFMQWKWQWEDKIYHAIRAVDTATHPNHQGKGIFKKLTLQQLELCKQQGVDFVFNTPNDQSRPGYLKMGWKQQGKLPLKIKLFHPATMAFRKLFKSKLPAYNFEAATMHEWKNVFQLFENQNSVLKNGLHTPTTADYLKWRYATNPLFPYRFISDGENYLLIYRIKSHSAHIEIRITDFMLYNSGVSIAHHISKNLKEVARKYKVDMMSVSGNTYLQYIKYFKVMGWIPVRPLGPIVTLRQVNSELEFEQLMNTANWEYSLGDLELF